jgi:peptidoglycan/LPS O-acetylase OafA/YrhL
MGGLGVQVFFVISGFLITTLLIKEEQAHDQISIQAFYVRRVCRILPAFALFMLAVFALRAGGLIQLDNEAFVRSAAFLCNVSEFKCSWWLAHTWSLSVEEQFYLVWPLLFVLLRTVRVPALMTILFLLVVGSLCYAQLTSFAHIAIGALAAASSRVQNVFARFATAWPIGIAVGVLLLMPLLPASFVLLSNLIHAITPFLTAVAFFGTISRAGPLVSIIENRLVQKIGLVSYSVYLWQQLGTAPEIWNGMITGATTLYAHHAVAASFFFLPAVISYLMIERSFIGLGRVFSEELITARSGRTGLPKRA